MITRGYVGIAIGGGIFTGWILRLPVFDQPSELFHDRLYWFGHSIEEDLSPKKKKNSTSRPAGKTAMSSFLDEINEGDESALTVTTMMGED